MTDFPHKRNSRLGALRRLESNQAFLFPSCWLMGILDPIIQSLVGAMLGTGEKVFDGLYITPELICHDDARFRIGAKKPA